MEVVNLTIKNLPDKTAKKLKKAAAENHRSVNGEVIHIIEQAMEENDRRWFIRTHHDELEKFVASLPKLPSSVPLIREDRRKR